MVKGLCTLCLSVLLLGTLSFAYTPTTRDVVVMQKAEEKLDIITETGGKERLVPLFSNILDIASGVTQERSRYVLEYILQYTARILETSEQVTMTRDALIEGVSLIEVTAVADEVDDSEEIEEIEEVVSDATVAVVDTSSLQGFYDTYKGSVTSSTPISELCTKYFDQIDAVAKQHDFPTSVIIATWFREHTCIFKNPDNNRGNFQITSHSYPPGAISRADFENQIVNFIAFSKAKWDYYDDIQVFGPEPVTLSYDSIDLTSLRKQAILYNGITSTLQDNIYANQNFGSTSSGRDGIVAMTIRALGWQLNRDRSGVLESTPVPEPVVEEEIVEETIQEPVEEVVEEEVVDAPEEIEEVTPSDCEDVFTEDLGPDANHAQVLAMQNFLKEQGLYSGTPNGVYDEKTTEAVNAFQAYYKTDILDPGGYDGPTGYRYPATRRKANALACE